MLLDIFTDSCLLRQVTTLLLDKMRRIKNRMVRLKTRVETIRELLEKFLEDESDMKSMNLTARCDPCTLSPQCSEQTRMVVQVIAQRNSKSMVR